MIFKTIWYYLKLHIKSYYKDLEQPSSAVVGTLEVFLSFFLYLKTLKIDKRDNLFKKTLKKTANIFASTITVVRGTPMIVQAIIIY